MMLPGQGADIGPPVAADLGLVMDAAERDADELPFHRPGDRLAERGLADARRADETQDRRLALGGELAHGEILDDAPLDLVEAEMVLVEDAPRLLEVDRLLRRQLPWQLDQPVEIGADHAVFGRRLGHALEPAQLAPRLVLDLLRHLGLGDRLAELGDLVVLAVGFAELLLDRRHLLAKQHLALPLVERGAGLLADLLRQPQHLNPLGEETRHAVDAGGEIDRLEHLLLLFQSQVEIGGDDVRQCAGVGDRVDLLHHLLRHLGQQLERLQRLALEVDEARLDLGRLGLALGLDDPLDAGDQEWPAVEELDHPEALFALGDGMMASVLAGQVADDIGDRADPIEVDHAGVVDVAVALGEDADLPFAAHRVLGRGDRARPAERHRHHHAGEQHQLAHRDDGDGIVRDRPLAGGAGLGFFRAEGLGLCHVRLFRSCAIGSAGTRRPPRA
jgi:hypothetical protein